MPNKSKETNKEAQSVASQVDAQQADLLKFQVLAQSVFKMITDSSCNDEEIMRALAIVSSNCIALINKNNPNQARIVANNFSDHIKDMMIQAYPQK
ncbi:hypothetical protein AwWohl_11210 [Gammaproteobacteria bacterium]|nr:hypothetical protein AwWohl_11210 [Gammaproteobacteria bacterium]